MSKDDWKLDQYLDLLRTETEAWNNSEISKDSSWKPQREKLLTLQTLSSPLDRKFE